MRPILALSLALAPFAAAPASAAIVYLANGQLAGTTDLSGLTAPLENGVPGNMLGGLGSGLAYAGGNTFIAVPDRGPNAVSYNSAVDDTTSYINRFQTLTLALSANNSGSGLPFNLATSLDATTLLSSPTPLTYGTGAGLGNRIDGTPMGSGAPSQNSAGTYYFTGRSDNFGARRIGRHDQCPLRPGIDPRVERRQERLHLRRIWPLCPPVRPRDRFAHQDLHRADQPRRRGPSRRRARSRSAAMRSAGSPTRAWKALP